MARKPWSERNYDRTSHGCHHKCHKTGLNPWIKACPICGCPNPKFDDSKPPMTFDEWMEMIDKLGGKSHGPLQSVQQ